LPLAERVQLRLKRLPGWKMPAEGKAIDRVRRFDDPLVAAAYLAFASLLARAVRQPLQVSLTDGNEEPLTVVEPALTVVEEPLPIAQSGAISVRTTWSCRK
jgi:hypothetical protein